MNDKQKEKKGKVFVTGASGFVGSHIVDRLLEEDHEVVVLVRPTSEISHLKQSGIHMITGDIRDETIVSQAVRDVDIIVHAAATFVGDWENHYQINVKATRILLEKARLAGVKKVILISSISIYPLSTIKKGQVISEDMGYEEKDLNNYSRSKIEQEKIVKEYYEQYGLKYSIIRPGSIYGPRGPLFPAMTGLALGNSRIALIGRGKNPVPLSYVENVADAVLLCIEKETTDNSSYNLVEDTLLTRKEYLNAIREKVDPDLSIIKMPYILWALLKFSLKTVFGLMGRKAPLSALNLKTYSMRLNFSTDRFKRDIRSKPYIAFNESINRTLLWYKNKRTPRRITGLSENYRVDIPATKQLKVGIVGCGGISIEHVSALHKMKNVQLTALADVNQEVREDMAQKFTISNTFANVDEMLSTLGLDVVHIITPPQTHADIAIKAMNKKCHVFVEKPMAVDAEEANKMVQAARANKVKLCVDHNILYDEVMIDARKILADNLIGDIAYMECWFGTEFNPYGPYGNKDHWVYELPGLLYHDFIVHPLYLLLDVMGGKAECKNVSSKYIRSVPYMDTDELVVTLENKEQFGTLHLSNAVSPRYQFLNVYGTEGTLKIDFLNKFTFVDKGISMLPRTINRCMSSRKLGSLLKSRARKNLIKGLTGKFSLCTGIDRLIQLFYRSILMDESVPVSGEEGLRSMEIMDKIWQQIKC